MSLSSTNVDVLVVNKHRCPDVLVVNKRRYPGQTQMSIRRCPSPTQVSMSSQIQMFTSSGQLEDVQEGK